MNIISVVYAKRNNILVYPTGLLGTGIFVYILLNFSLLGDTIINAYFFSALSITEVFEDYIQNYKIKNVANKLLYASAVAIPLITIILIYYR